MLMWLTQQQTEILGHMSIVFLDDGAGNLVNKTIRISGVNVQIVNGSGTTNNFSPLSNSLRKPCVGITSSRLGCGSSGVEVSDAVALQPVARPRTRSAGRSCFDIVIIESRELCLFGYASHFPKTITKR